MRRIFRRSVGSLMPFILVAMAASVHAQILRGRIVGTVRDESGAVVPGVTITLTSPALPGGPSTAVTDAKGEYRLTELTPGVYALHAELSGFATYQEDGLRVGANATLERHVRLRVAAVEETISVSGATPIVDARQTALSIALPNEKVANLTVNHYAIQDFAAFLPGVSRSSPGADWGGQTTYIMGSQDNETAYLIDGITTNDSRSGGNWNASDMHAVEEVQVTAVGASAEYQIAQGGVFSVVLKSGTNAFKGDVVSMWRPDALVSKPITLDCRCPARQSGYTSRAYRDRSAHLGGPIVRDRAWFFGGVQFKGLTSLNPGQDPDLVLPFSPYDHVSRGSAKVTLNGTSRLRFSSVFEQEYWREPAFPDLSRPLSTIPSSGGSEPFYGEEMTATVSDRTLLTVRVSGRIIPHDYRDPIFGDRATPIHVDALTGLSSGGVAQIDRREEGRHMVSAKLARFFRSGPFEHDFRVGLQWERTNNFDASTYPSGVQYSDLGGKPDQATFREPFVDGAASHAQGVWIDDQLTTARITVQAGVRFDRMSAESPDVPAVDYQLENNGKTIAGLGHMFTWQVWSPRGGVTAKLTQDGRTVLRASVGRYYSPIFLNTIAGVHPGLSPTTVARFDPATGQYSTVLQVTDPLANISVDRGAKDQYTNQYSIGIDRQIARNAGVTVSYVRKDTRQQLGWKDIGGVYSAVPSVLPDGRVLTVLALQNSPSQRKFLLTNGPGFFTRYNGLLLSLDKRYSNRWLATVTYALSKTEGLRTTASATSTAGRDPNDYINLLGRIATADRPHIFGMQASYLVPAIAVNVSPSLQWQSGVAFAPQASVSLPQARLSINIEPPGSYRTPSQRLLAVQVSRDVWHRGARRVRALADFTNLLQNETYQNLITRNFFNANFGLPASWIPPRMAVVGLKAEF
jgi:hypothetical protein